MPKKPVRPLTFLEFCQLLGVELRPGQRVLCAVAFDGISPASLSAEDREIAARIFGPHVDTVSAKHRAVVAAVCGARAGKSYLLGALRLLHLALTVPIDRLAPGEVAVALVVAPDIRLAKQTIRYVKGAVRSHPQLARQLLGETEDTITLARPGGRKVSVECLPATRGGASLRGRSLVGVILDEAAFFRDESYQVNDAELYRAIAPRVLPGGQLVIASTPWAKTGLLWQLYHDNWDGPVTCLAAHAATLLLRDEPHIVEQIERETARDPENARREFGAEFMTAGAGAFFDASAIDQSTVPMVLGRKPGPGATVTAGCDLGFVSDSSALVIVHRYGHVYEVAELLEMKPGKDEPLRPSEVIEAFARIARKHGAIGIMSDVHYREAVRESLRSADLVLYPAPEGSTGKIAVYTKAKALFAEGRVRIPDHPKLLRQLREISGKATSGGSLSITSPRGPGGHGDIVSALVLALYQASGHEVAAPKPREGSTEWWALEESRMIRGREERLERDQSADWWEQ
jgi:hypothetical protein